MPLTWQEQQEAIRRDPRVLAAGRSVVDPRWFDPDRSPSAYPGVNAEEWSDALATVDSGDSPVQQQFADEVDVNTIVKRFGIDRVAAIEAMGVYVDFSGILDFEDAVARVEGARARFMELPAEVRSRFDNDPGRLIAAVNELSEAEFARVMDPPVAAAPAKPAPAGDGASAPTNSGGAST